MTSPLNTFSPSPFLDAFIPCTGCRLDRHPSMFTGRTRNYRTCSVCRYRQTVPTMAPVFDEMVFLSDLPIDPTFFSQGTENVIEMDIFLNDELANLDDGALVKDIFDAVEQQTGYRHYRQRIGEPILSQSIIFYGTCMQRSENHQQLDPTQRIRQVVSMPTYDCRGEIKGQIRRDQNWIHLTIEHHMNHEAQPTNRVFLSEEEVAFLTDNAATMTTPELYHATVRQFGDHITRAQVYHWRLSTVEREYNRNRDDQFLSAMLLVNEWNDRGYEEVRDKRGIKVMD